MKSLTSSSTQTPSNTQARLSSSARSENRPHLRVIRGPLPDKAQLPPQAASAKVEISDEGRRMLSLLADRTEMSPGAEAAQETIASLVAEGLEEGFFE